jgi:hypothetical protein
MYSKCLSGRIKREEEFGDKKERYAEEVLGGKKNPPPSWSYPNT